MAPPNGCALCERKESSQWHKNTDTGERDICDACYQNQRAIGMAPSNGCALCERKESSRWHKNTDTGERDICAACYQNQRAIGMAPSNGCALCERKESSRWHKNTDTGERDICSVLPKSTCYRNGTIERVCSVREEGEFTLAQKYRYGRKIFVLRATKINVL